jgi:hypothetical protein
MGTKEFRQMTSVHKFRPATSYKKTKSSSLLKLLAVQPSPDSPDMSVTKTLGLLIQCVGNAQVLRTMHWTYVLRTFADIEDLPPHTGTEQFKNLQKNESI